MINNYFPLKRETSTKLEISKCCEQAHAMSLMPNLTSSIKLYEVRVNELETQQTTERFKKLDKIQQTTELRCQHLWNATKKLSRSLTLKLRNSITHMQELLGLKKRNANAVRSRTRGVPGQKTRVRGSRNHCHERIQNEELHLLMFCRSVLISSAATNSQQYHPTIGRRRRRRSLCRL